MCYQITSREMHRNVTPHNVSFPRLSEHSSVNGVAFMWSENVNFRLTSHTEKHSEREREREPKHRTCSDTLKTKMFPPLQINTSSFFGTSAIKTEHNFSTVFISLSNILQQEQESCYKH